MLFLWGLTKNVVAWLYHKVLVWINRVTRANLISNNFTAFKIKNEKNVCLHIHKHITLKHHIQSMYYIKALWNVATKQTLTSEPLLT